MTKPRKDTKDTYGLKSMSPGEVREFRGATVRKVYALARYYESKGYPLRVSWSAGVVTVRTIDPAEPPKKKNHTKWTPEMDKLLKEMRQDDIPFDFCAEVISRETGRTLTPYACISRLQTLKGKRRRR